MEMRGLEKIQRPSISLVAFSDQLTILIAWLATFLPA